MMANWDRRLASQDSDDYRLPSRNELGVVVSGQSWESNSDCCEDPDAVALGCDRHIAARMRALPRLKPIAQYGRDGPNWAGCIIWFRLLGRIGINQNREWLFPRPQHLDLKGNLKVNSDSLARSLDPRDPTSSLPSADPP